MSQALGYFQNPYPKWPQLPSRLVEIGGTGVSYADAARALEALSASTGIMVRQVLRAHRNPLADCDYHAAAAPFREQFLLAPAFGRGAAGRPATKQAFMAAVARALDAAEAAEPARHYAAELKQAREAFSSDAGYAVSMARAAVAVLEREHEADLRKMISQAVHQAISACDARRGQFTCTTAAACGTGSCRFAAGVLAEIDVLAGCGRTPRPANHVPGTGRSGDGFGTAPALAELARRLPFTVAVRVAASDRASAGEAVAA